SILKGRFSNRPKINSFQTLIDVEGGTTGYKIDLGSGWGIEYYSRYGELLYATGEAGLESPGITPLDIGSLGAGVVRGLAKQISRRIANRASKKISKHVEEPDVFVHEIFTERIK